MGHFEKGVSTALCVLCLAAGVLLAVLGFGGSYGGGSAGLFLGALMFITVPAVMLFGLYGGSAAKKTSTDPVGIVVGASLVLVSVGAACVYENAWRAQRRGRMAACSGGYAHCGNIYYSCGGRRNKKEKIAFFT